MVGEGTARFQILDDLCESRLFPSRLSLKRYTAKDVCDFIFLYCIALQILRSEFEYLDFTADYAREVLRRGNFRNFYFGSNDLYVLLHIMETQSFKPHKSNELFLKNIKFTTGSMTMWLRNIRMNRRNDSLERRFLLGLQDDLNISDGGYRAMRRLCTKWGKDATRLDKQLILTRLLLAMRTRCRRSDLLPKLEELAKKNRLEIKNAQNPEVGKSSEPRKSSFLAKAAAAAAGLAAGHYLAKRKS